VGWFESFLTNIAAAAAWQAISLILSKIRPALFARAVFLLGSLFILIGEWLRKKGALVVKHDPLLTPG
jgi:hypothetical protein